MTDASPVRLPGSMRDQIIAHARREAPRECCGVIVGSPGDLLELHELTNTYEGVDFYEPEPGQLFQVIKAADERGWDITAIYHSHPVSVAFPSARDVEHAGWPESIYIICSLETPDAPYLRAFNIVENQISEREIELT
jgi:[CysO sulfur-carrier protein]-S-L-cysteine hydrolase